MRENKSTDGTLLQDSNLNKSSEVVKRETALAGKSEIAYKVMTKMGWTAGKGLGKSESGQKIPIGCRVVPNNEGIAGMVSRFLGERQVNVGLCEERGRPCVTCDKREGGVYTIYNSLDDGASDEEINPSLPKLPEIAVEMYGRQVQALIDTGSQITGITTELYDSIQSQVGPLPEVPIPALQIQGAFGSRSESVKRLVLVNIGLGSSQIETPVLVLRRLPRSIVLGFDWLERVKGVIKCGPCKSLVIEHLGLKTEIRVGSQDETEKLGGAINAIEIKSALVQSDREREVRVVNSIESKSTLACDNETAGVSIADCVASLGLESSHKTLLLPVLQKNREVFAHKLGLTDKYTHQIKMADETPFVKRSYPIPIAHREQVKEKIEELEQLGVIKREATPYCSPLTYTKKKDGSVRLLLDARELNKRMVGDSEAPPFTSEILQSFHGVKYISLIDLNNAYFQIPLDKESTKYTGFTFMGKTYTYAVLPQGLKTSVASFSRAMDVILGGVRDFCVNYLDDLIVYTSGDLELHLDHIDQVLTRLRDANMTCNVEKCSFLQTEVKLLGHIVNTEGIRMDPDKTKAIQDFPVPKTVKQVRAFLGLINYFRRFIRKYGEETKPMCELLRKDVKWKWTQVENDCFERVKGLFLETVMLIHPDVHKTYYLQTDSSAIGIAGCIYQLSEDGEELVIGFCSKGLTEAEMRWTVTEQELWAIVYSLTKFETYLRGAKLVIRTDHKSLTFLNSCKLLSARMIRWVHYIGRFDYHVEYVKGKDNVVADVLSRHIKGVTDILTSRNQGPQMNLFRTACSGLIREQFRSLDKHQINDESLKEIIGKLRNPNVTDGDIERQGYVLNDDILYYIKPKTKTRVLVIPEAMQRELITNVHEEVGHFGRFKVLALMRDRYYFAGMSRKITKVLRECEVCQKSKHEKARHSGPSKPVKAEEVGELVFADLYGPLPSGMFGNKFIFVIQDSFSKFIKLYPLKRATGKSVVPCVKKFHTVINIAHIVTDNGAQFISRVWEDELSRLGIRLSHTSVRNPRPNSTERVNKELGRMFRTYCDKSHKSWVSLIPQIEDCYNKVIHTSTGYSPEEVLWGRSTILSTDKLLARYKLTGSAITNVDEIRDKARENLLKAAESREAIYNKNHRLIRFNIGDYVKLKTFPKSDADKKLTKKFAHLYIGPFRIGAIPHENVYTLICPDSNEIKGNYNAIHLFRYYISTGEKNVESLNTK